MIATQTKLARLLALMTAERWPEALKLASQFRELGEHRDQIQRGYSALNHPRWSAQMGRDPQADIEAGVAALRARYARHL